MSKKRKGGSAAGLARQGITAISQGKVREAESCLRKIRQIDTMHTEGEYLAGLIAATKGNYAAAEKEFGSAIQSQPKAIEFYMALAKVYAMQAKTQQAIQILVAAINVDPKDVEVRILFADQLQTSGDLGGSLKVFEGLFAEGIRTPEVITGLGLFNPLQIQKSCDRLALRFLGFSRGVGRIDQALREYSQQFPMHGKDCSYNHFAFPPSMLVRCGR